MMISFLSPTGFFHLIEPIVSKSENDDVALTKFFRNFGSVWIGTHYD